MKELKDLLDDFLKDKKEKIEKREKIERILDKFLEEDLKNHLHLKGIYKKRLVFYVDNASFGYVFNLKKEEVLEKIKKEFPQIEEIKIKVGC
jgi:hypothetical protein